MSWVKIDCSLKVHLKALRAEKMAPGAMGFWLWCNLHSREQELDGFIPDESMAFCWSGRRARERFLVALTTVQLLKVEPGGLRIVNYERHNQLKGDLEETRQKDRNRKKPDTSKKIPDGIPTDSANRREEKRREERRIEEKRSGEGADAPSPKRGRAKELPEGWQPSEKLVDDIRRKLHVDPMPAVERMTDWARSKSVARVDWDATFRNWVREDVSRNKLPLWAPPRPAPKPPEAGTPATLEQIAEVNGLFRALVGGQNDVDFVDVMKAGT